MLHRVALSLLVVLATLAMANATHAEEAPVKSTVELPNDDAKLAYGIGVRVATDLKAQPFGVNAEEFWDGFQTGSSDGELKIAQAAWMEMAQGLQMKMESESPEFTAEETAAISYMMGVQTGRGMQNTPMDIDDALFRAGFGDVIEGRVPAMTDEEIMATMEAAEARLRAEMEKKENEAMAKNTAEGTAFLEENGKREGVKTTESGLQYEVLTEGSGASPKSTDTVSVHYRGTLIDGTEFDSSHSRGEPTEFRLDQVIPGWTEGLQLMNKGAKYKFAIPSGLAYGPRQVGDKIGPNSTLVFEVELLDVKGEAPSVTLP